VTLTDTDLTKTNSYSNSQAVAPTLKKTATFSENIVTLTLPPASWQVISLSVRENK